MGSQKQTAPFELKTDSHTLLNASLVVRPIPERDDFTIVVSGRNLTDQDARNHVSFTKELLPLPGRDIHVSAKLRF